MQLQVSKIPRMFRCPLNYNTKNMAEVCVLFLILFLNYCVTFVISLALSISLFLYL